MKENKEETKTDNELVAEFMGVQNVFVHPTFGAYEAEDDQGWIDWVDGGIRTLDYHRDWNLLIPVVEKIENIEGVYVRIQKDRCIIFDSGFGESDILIREQRQPNQYPAASVNQPSKIEAVYKAIVQFIKFYNAQQHERK